MDETRFRLRTVLAEGWKDYRTRGGAHIAEAAFGVAALLAIGAWFNEIESMVAAPVATLVPVLWKLLPALRHSFARERARTAAALHLAKTAEHRRLLADAKEQARALLGFEAKVRDTTQLYGFAAALMVEVGPILGRLPLMRSEAMKHPNADQAVARNLAKQLRLAARVARLNWAPDAVMPWPKAWPSLRPSSFDQVASDAQAVLEEMRREAPAKVQQLREELIGAQRRMVALLEELERLMDVPPKR